VGSQALVAVVFGLKDVSQARADAVHDADDPVDTRGGAAARPHPSTRPGPLRTPPSSFK
jgi:hypothetical protein